VSQNDSNLLSLDNPAIDLLKYEGTITELSKAIFSFNSSPKGADAETVSYVYLHEDMIRGVLDGKILGKGTKLSFNSDKQISMTLLDTKPNLETGQLGRLSASIIDFRPCQVFNEFNVIFCISTGEDMDVKDIELKTRYSLKQRFSAFTKNISDLEAFLSKLEKRITRSEAALLFALLAIHEMSVNKTEGKFALVVAGESLRKFTIQRGDSIQSYAEFANDIQSEEVLISLVYTILDSSAELNGKRKLSAVFRAVAEALEDFKIERSTLVILLTTDLGEELDDISPFIRAITRNERYHFDVIGLGNDFNPETATRILDKVDATVYPMNQFSAHFFDQYLLNAIDRLFSKSHYPESAIDS
jgi:hypothetical protein